jgi:hypothetical protein
MNASQNGLKSGVAIRIALGFLVPLNIAVSYLDGKLHGMHGGFLVGYCFGGLMLLLIILGLSQLWKRARSESAVLKVALIALSVITFVNCGTTIRDIYKAVPADRLETSGSFAVDNKDALAFAQSIQELTQKDDLKSFGNLLDADGFVQRIQQHRKPLPDANLIRAASETFMEGDQFAALMRNLIALEAGLHLVKVYGKSGQTILQFRSRETSGLLHYVDLYLFKTDSGAIRIADYQHFNNGPPVSHGIKFLVIGNLPGIERDDHAIALHFIPLSTGTSGAVDVFEILHIDANHVAGLDELRDHDLEVVLQSGALPRVVLLAMQRRRRLCNTNLDNVRKSDADRLPCNELDGKLELGLQEFSLRTDEGVGDGNLLESCRIHEVGLVAVRVQKLQDLLFDRKLLELQFSPEVDLSIRTRREISQSCVSHSAHFPLAGMVLAADDFIFLIFMLDGHSGPQLGRDDHSQTSSGL